MSGFVHLHVHTEYSLLDGFAAIDKVMDRVRELGMSSVAITDHGTMFGVIDFYKAAKKKGIKPIIGCEVYTSPRGMEEKDPIKDKNQGHLVLLAKNNEGYQNLIHLVSSGFTRGFYYKPRIDYDLLEQHKEGLVVLSACLAGDIQNLLVQGQYAQAMELTLRLKAAFGEDFYLELQDHGLQEQKQINPLLVKLSRETGVQLVATNDSHYVYQEDAEAHDILLCIQTGKVQEDKERLKFPNDQFYLKSEQEMADLFPYAPEALANTLVIADKCQVDFDFNTIHLPEYELPPGRTETDYLRQVCYEGFHKRYETATQELTDRLEYELKIIQQMGYGAYFLIVWDFIKFAKDHGIPVGPGRGSAAGSLVAYSLGITDIDPIRYNLLFERFLNPERISMPDIDIDFCYERREEVIDYVKDKYGEEKVAQIITFGTMAARAAIRDVGRVINLSYGEVDQIAKQVPFALGMTLDKALEVNPVLREMAQNDESANYLIQMAKKLEGMPRHASTHAAGVVIAKKALDQYVPLYMHNDSVTTQFTMGNLEELGLLKMDFLGLRTLTVIHDALQLIESSTGKKLDFSVIGYEDPKVYQLISKGDTLGLFQLESAGMIQFLKELKPDCFEDIIAGISLYRPGPMDSIPKYIQNKNNADKIQYKHGLLEPILNVTYGCMVYQEQVMQVVRDLAGYSYGRSDLVRRAMSKKKMDVMEEERHHFIYGKTDEGGNVELPGCVRNGVPEKIANEIFDEMIDFANYAFNKSHAAAYAVLAYQTGYLKAYYPVEFMAALMTSVMGHTSKVAQYIQDCKRMGIEVLQPDINRSYSKFTVEDGKIRFGLAAVKNVGFSMIHAIVAARNAKGAFTGFLDFCEKVESKDLNKRAVESLIKCGAFDCLLVKRAQLLAGYEKIMEGVAQSRKRNLVGQIGLFDLQQETEGFARTDALPNIKEYDERTKLNLEKEVLGLYVSGHPLSHLEAELSQYVSVYSNELAEAQENPEETGIYDGARVRVGGIVADRSHKTTRTNEQMAFITIEDLYGTMECIVFPKMLKRYYALLERDTPVLIEGTLNFREEETPKIIVNRMASLAQGKGTEEVKYLILVFDREEKLQALESVKPLLRQHHGQVPVYYWYQFNQRKGQVSRDYWVTPSQALFNALREELGEEGLQVVT